MTYDTVAEIYLANSNIRAELLSVLETVSPDMSGARSDGQKWSIAEIVEHLSMVEEGVLKICSKLLAEAKAAGRPAGCKISFSNAFKEGTAAAAATKIEAPDRVRPSGERSIGESVTKLTELQGALLELQNDLGAFDLSDHHFPHPVFGDMTAIEWLVLLGWHEARHTRQIEGLLAATSH